MAAQSLAVDTVTGATVTSKAILAAAEQALTEAGADIEALKTAAPKAEQAEGETIEMTTDVVVVGAAARALRLRSRPTTTARASCCSKS